MPVRISDGAERTWGSVQVPRGETITWWLLLSLCFIAVGLIQSSAPPTAITGWRIATGMVLFGLLVLAGDTARSDPPRTWRRTFSPLLAGVLLLILVFRYRSPTLPIGEPSWFELLVLFGLLGVFLVGSIDVEDITPIRVSAIGMVAVVLALFIYHTTTTPVWTPAPTWPIWAVVVCGVSLLLLPRYVPIQCFLWSVSILAAIASTIAIYAIIGGEFTFLGFEVVVVDQEFPFTDQYPDGWYGVTSIFNNINVFGLVTFAGLSTAAFSVHRSYVDAHAIATVAASLLVVLNGIGLLLSSSDASWIAAGVTLGVFGAYLAFGARSIAPTVLGGLVFGGVAVGAVYLGHLPIDDGGRFDRWRSGIRAMRANPSWVGHGYISTADFVQPYHPRGSHGTPHNSYLSILIRMGTVGALAYLILIWGTVAYRAITPDTTNVAMLAFTLGWAVHHLFESYTIIQWTPPAVLSAMTLGYLLFGPSTGSRPSR